MRVHRIGPKPKSRSAKPRKIIAKFHWFKDRELVWAARKQIPKTRGIFISEDWPAEIEQKRRILDPVAKEARRLGHRAGLSVDRLWIDDQNFTVHDIDRLPAKLHPANLATKSKDNITAFFLHPAHCLTFIKLKYMTRKMDTLAALSRCFNT